MMVNLAPLEKDFGLDMASFYLPKCFGTGQKGLNELAEQVKGQFNMAELTLTFTLRLLLSTFFLR